MVRGGRGYGRGGDYSYRHSNSSYRGDAGSRRNFNEGVSSFSGSDYRSNYGGSGNHNSSSAYQSRNRDRFSSARHGDSRHESNKRSYVSDRDRSSEKKRQRHEDTRLNATTYSSSSASSTYRRNDLHRTRQPDSPVRSSSYRDGRRDESSTHRHTSSAHHMGPPKRPTTTRTPRLIRSRIGGGIDSPIANSRGTRGSAIRRGGRMINRKSEYTMKVMRSQILVSKHRERIRKLKLAQLSSIRKRRRPISRRSQETSRKSRERNADNAENDDETNETANDDDDKDNSNKSDRVKLYSEKSTNGISVDIKEESNESKKGEDDSKSVGKVEGKITDADDDGVTSVKADVDKTKTNDDVLESKKISIKKEIREKDLERHNRDHSLSNSPRKKKSFIKLMCVHCQTLCLTFKNYLQHLYSRSHRTVMKRIAIRQKAQLAKMRQRQRNAQRELDNNSKDVAEDSQPQFCLLCRLNYRQPKAKHQLSEDHRNMKKFLMPYCSTCHIAFKSPMVYEAHRCSLDHIKRKARNNESNSENGSDEREVDLNNFMTVDSIGEIDETILKNLDDITEEKANVGSQFVKKTDSFYCSLCQLFFPYADDEASFIQRHCAGRSHLKAYIQYTEDEDLQAKARRVERKKDSDRRDKKKATSEPPKSKEIDLNEEDKILNEEDDDEEEELSKEISSQDLGEENIDDCAASCSDDDIRDESQVGDEHYEDVSVGALNEEQILALTKDDRLWEDVDRDLGDLLAEIAQDEANNDDEDEDESVLNIDIESEKQKTCGKIVNDADDIKTENNLKKKLKSKNDAGVSANVENKSSNAE